MNEKLQVRSDRWDHSVYTVGGTANMMGTGDEEGQLKWKNPFSPL